MELENTISIIAASIAIIGIFLTLIQLYQTKKIKKAEFTNDLLKTIRSNSKISKVEYLLEYGEPWYDDDFHNSELEPIIDDFLAQFNFICFLKENKYLGKREFKIFEYEVNRIFQNFDCVCYLWNLYHWSLYQGKQCSFSYLISYGKTLLSEKEKVSFESKDEKTSGFKKYLNF